MIWRRGITLMTNITKHWRKEDIEKNNIIEQTMIFESFKNIDDGRGRQLVCTLERFNSNYEKNAKLIEAAPEMYNIIKEIYNTNNDSENKEILNLRISKLIEKLS